MKCQRCDEEAKPNSKYCAKHAKHANDNKFNK
jgi:hypothetical protein